MYFPHVPVPKAACFGLNYSQIPQGWVFSVTTLLVSINFNGQSTIIKMFHEVFRNVHRNLLEGTNQLVTVTTQLRLGDFTALTLIKAFSKIALVPKTQSRGKEVLPQFVKSGGRSKLCDFPKIKVYKELKNDHRLLQALSQRLRKKIKAYVAMFRIRKSKLIRRCYIHFTNGKRNKLPSVMRSDRT